jgi:hypothetical protein
MLHRHRDLSSSMPSTLFLLFVWDLLSRTSNAPVGTLTMAATIRATSSTSEKNDRIVLEDFSRPNHVWQEMNDPVMGGKSTGTFIIDADGGGVGVGIAKFQGEVVNVPFLQAPGFIQSRTTDDVVFPDISSCQAIQIICKSNSKYNGYRISFGNAHAPHGKFFAYGYKADLKVPPPSQQRGHEDPFDTVTIPITSFTDYWDDATGDPIKVRIFCVCCCCCCARNTFWNALSNTSLSFLDTYILYKTPPHLFIVDMPR